MVKRRPKSKMTENDYLVITNRTKIMDALMILAGVQLDGDQQVLFTEANKNLRKVMTELGDEIEKIEIEESH